MKKVYNLLRHFALCVGILGMAMLPSQLDAQCTTPTATAAVTQPTCSGGVAQSNGTITISGFTAGQRYQYSSGATFNSGAATPVAITAIPMSGVITSTLPNTTQQYTVRIYDAADDACFVDRVVSMTAVNFTTSSTVPACHANGTPEDASDDFINFDITITNAPQSSQLFTVTATQNGNPVTIQLANGGAANAVNCGLRTPLRTPAATAGQGNIIVTVTDNLTGCTQMVTITDPGTCAVICTPGTSQMTMYGYRTQFDITDLNSLPIVIPQFDDMGGTRTLTSVKLDYEVGFTTTAIMENRAANPQTFEATFLCDANIDLGSNTIANPSLSVATGELPFVAGIIVPAQGTYPGDVTPPSFIQVPSTILGMEPWLIDEKLNFFKDPLSDSRWVTNATGNPAHDDDMTYFPPTSDSDLGSITYNTVATMAPFVGSGSVPLTASTSTRISAAGGGGNVIIIQRTRAYAYAKVTYTYECAVQPCVNPTATAAATQPTCSGGVAQSNGTITISSFTNERYQYSAGATFNSGAAIPALITAIPVGGVITSTLPNTTQQYTVRIYDATDDNCYVDQVVSVTAVACASYAIGSTVFEDLNNNGTQDSGEPGIGGVTVQLWSVVGAGKDPVPGAGDDTQVGTDQQTSTGATPGNYFFDALLAGQYYVVIPQTGNFGAGNPLEVIDISSTITDTNDNEEDGDDNGVQMGGTGTMTMSPVIELGESNGEPTGAQEGFQGGAQDDGPLDAFGDMTVDFGFFAPVSLGDTTWVDLNGNGRQDALEPPLPGVKVTLFNAATNAMVTLDADGNTITGMTTTNAMGFYEFTNLLPGNYYVVFDISTAMNPEYYVLTTANQGPDTDDSDADPVTGQTAPTGFLPSGTSYPDLDAGVVCQVGANITVMQVTTCSTRNIEISALGASITPNTLNGVWSTSGTGMFIAADQLTVNANFVQGGGGAAYYMPSAADIAAGGVTLTLTTNTPPVGVACPAASDSVQVTILKVNCGSFPWNGN